MKENCLKGKKETGGIRDVIYAWVRERESFFEEALGNVSIRDFFFGDSVLEACINDIREFFLCGGDVDLDGNGCIVESYVF